MAVLDHGLRVGERAVVGVAAVSSGPVQLAWRRANPERVREWRRRDAAKNPHTRRAYKLRSRYGMSLPEYEAMVKAQNGLCAIGGCPPSTSRGQILFIDHSHETGRVRGLLCSKHNRLLGMVKDNADELRIAATYLERAV